MMMLIVVIIILSKSFLIGSVKAKPHDDFYCAFALDMLLRHV